MVPKEWKNQIDMPTSLVSGYESCDFKLINLKNSSQSAIVRGAALRGLEGRKSRRTYARFHYGYAALFSFREGIDREEFEDYDEFDGEKKCLQMRWFIEKVRTRHRGHSTGQIQWTISGAELTCRER